MAELNFGLLTPPGSQSIGNAFAQGMDQAAVARAQENQNALAQYTLGKAKREDELTNKMLAGLQGATTIEQQAAVLRSVGKVREASELMASDLERRYKLGQIEAQPGARARADAETARLQSEARSKDIAEVASLPDAASASAAIDLRLSNKSITQQTADSLREGLTSENFPKWKHSTLMRLSTPVEQLKQSVVKTIDTDMGGSISRQTYDAQGVAVGAPTIIPKTPTLGSVPGIAQADIARARAVDEGIIPSGVAPAQPGTQVTQAAFPRITSQVQTQRNNEQIVLLNAELQKPENNNPVTQQVLRAEIAKLSTGNPFAAPSGDPLRPATVVNNTPGAAAAAAAPVVNNLPTAQPPAVAPTAYSPKMLRDMALKGMQPNGRGGQTPIPGGEADPVVKQQVSTAQAVGAQTGKNNAVALEKLPNAIKLSNDLVGKLDALIGDANVVNGQVMYNTAPAKGFNTAFGPTGIIARAYPGSEAADFQARVKEILGGAFLEAFETLRGGGAITETEGRKATEARTRMSFSQSQGEFITAAREYRKAVTDAIAASSTRLNSLQRSAAPAGAPPLDVIFNTQRPQ